MVSSTVEQQGSTVLVDGKLLSGDALLEYAQYKGLCPICVQTTTQKRVRKKFGRLRSGLEWEPLTVTDELAGNFTVYKGYCLQPTCWTLEEVQVKLGEKTPAKQKKPRRKKSPSPRRSGRRPSRHSVALSHGSENHRTKLESHSFMEKKPLKLIGESELIEETVRSLSARSADGAGFQGRGSVQPMGHPKHAVGYPPLDRSAHRRPTFANSAALELSAKIAAESDSSGDLSVAKQTTPYPSLLTDSPSPSCGGNSEHRVRNRRASRRHTEFVKQSPVSDQQPLTLASLYSVAERAEPDRRPSEQERRNSSRSQRRTSASSSGPIYERDSVTSSPASLLGEQQQQRTYSFASEVAAVQGYATKEDRTKILLQLWSFYMYEDEDGMDDDMALWNKLKSACNSQADLASEASNDNRHFQLLLRVIKQEQSRGEARFHAWELLSMIVKKKRLDMDSNHQLTMNFFQAISSVLDSEESDDGSALVKKHAASVLFSLIRLEELSTSSVFTNMITMLERSRRLEWVATLMDRLMFSESECDDSAESLFVVWKLLQLQSMQARDTGSVSCEEEMLMMTMIVGLVDSMLSAYASGEISANSQDAALKAESALGLLAFVASHAGATALASRQQECIYTICGTVLRYQFDAVILEGSKALCAIFPFFRWEDETVSTQEKLSALTSQVANVILVLLNSEKKETVQGSRKTKREDQTGVLACQLLSFVLEQSRSARLSEIDECKGIVNAMIELLKNSSNIDVAQNSSMCLLNILSQDAEALVQLQTSPIVARTLVECLGKHEDAPVVLERICNILHLLAAADGSSVAYDIERLRGMRYLIKLLDTAPDRGSLHEAVFKLLHCVIPALSDDFLVQSGSDLVNRILLVVESSSDGEVAEAGSIALSALLTELNKSDK